MSIDAPITKKARAGENASALGAIIAHQETTTGREDQPTQQRVGIADVFHFNSLPDIFFSCQYLCKCLVYYFQSSQ